MAPSPALLRQFQAFRSISDSQFEAIESLLRVESAGKGSFLIKRGKPLKTISFLLDGRVDLVDASFNSESVEAGSERSRQPLTEQSPSDVSALAKSPVEILQVEPQAFEILESWSEAPAHGSSAALAVEESGDDWMSSLLESPLFARVPPTQIQQLFTRFQPLKVQAGEAIVEEGAEGDYFYVIESGSARVLTRFDGEVAQLGPGQFFGEEALVGDTIRNASVIMASAGVLMRLDKNDFKALLQEPLIHYISAEELHKRGLEGASFALIDVRIPLEYRLGHVKDSSNMPLATLRKRLPGLKPETSYIITDDAGKRSEVAAHLLSQAGFTALILRDSASHYAVPDNRS